MRSRFLAGGVGSFVMAMLLAGAPQAAAQQTAGVAPRITQAVNDNNLVTLPGTVHPLARAQYDRGAVADSQPIRRVLLRLQRSPAQETALRTLLDSQQTKASSSFHQWLTPQQFGQQFGPADADVQTITSWLTAHGFQVSRVSTGRTVIEFSGNAGQVRDAFHTEIHQYVVNGEQHLANASPIQIPAALAPVVAGVVSLHNFEKKPQSRVRGVFTRDNASGEVKPLFTGTFQGTTFHALAPGDFYTIYNVPSANVASAVNGSGQTIAIVGDSEICTASSPEFSIAIDLAGCGNTDDVAQFRALFGLSTAKLPSVILDGPDPFFNSDETEGDLDTQWAGAVAPGATIDFVIAENTEASAGVDLAAEHIVDNNLAPVLSESFGFCEAGLGGYNGFYSALWEQAAAQGITVIVSAGDSGSAGCDDENTELTASSGLGVNGIASTPFNVAAGGTDFDISAAGYPSAYWNTTNAPGTQASAIKYIPETTWNDSCAQFATATLVCASANGSSLNIVSGGGGPSNCGSTNPSGACLAGYTKPAWQNGVTGIPSDGVRDLPDISLFASDGLLTNSFYIVCEADAQNGQPCSTSGITEFLGVGGTSSAAPAFAGIMAMVNQKMASLSLSARQGNANYILYPLAAAQSALSCNSTTTPNGGCTFNDVTRGNNSVPCAGGKPNCSTAVSNAKGILVTNGTTPAWNAGAGYDMATGLGTINVSNLVANWSPIEGAFTPTTTTLCLEAGSVASPTCANPPGAVAITHGSFVSGTIAVTPDPGTSSTAKAEDATLIGAFSGGTTAAVDRFDANSGNVDTYPLTNGQTSGIFTQELVGGTYLVHAHYAGDGTLGASDSNAISVTVAPEPSTAKVTVGTVNLLSDANPTLSSTPASVPYGGLDLVRVDVVGSTSGLETGTGNVTLTDNSNPIIGPTNSTVNSFSLNSQGYLEDQTTFLSVGSHSIVAKYNGDASYNASANSSAVSFSVTACPTGTTITTLPVTINPGQQVTIAAFVTTEVNGNPSGGSEGDALGGTVTFTAQSRSTLPGPVHFPRSPSWPVAGVAAAVGLILLLLLRFPVRQRWGTALAMMLLAAAVGVSVSCGGGSSGAGESTTTLGSASPSFVETADQLFVGGQASIVVTPAASETITATYSGDSNYKGSTSSAVTITVQ